MRFRTVKPLASQYHLAVPRKPLVKAHSTRVEDYSALMSGFERESLAAEAKLKTERRKKKKARSLGKNKNASSSDPDKPQDIGQANTKRRA